MIPLLYLTEPERPGRVQILPAMAPTVIFINIMFCATFNGFPSCRWWDNGENVFLPCPQDSYKYLSKNTQFLAKVIWRGLNFQKIKTSSFKMKWVDCLESLIFRGGGVTLIYKNQRLLFFLDWLWDLEDFLSSMSHFPACRGSDWNLEQPRIPFSFALEQPRIPFSRKLLE